MANTFKNIIRLLRYKHWPKNIFVLLGVFYTELQGFWPLAISAAIAFTLIASSVYIYNDICDLEEDKHHPLKKNRPLAASKVSLQLAYAVLSILLVVGFEIAYLVSFNLVIILLLYVIINILYNHWLRNILGLDVLCIAAGFMLRVFAGTIGIGLPITWWLTITATLMSLLIALSKRRLEIYLNFSTKKRTVLKKYQEKGIDSLILASAALTFFAYLFYIIFNHPFSFYFIITLPFAALGLLRFVYLVTDEVENDDPLVVFFQDPLSVMNLGMFVFLTYFALHQ